MSEGDIELNYLKNQHTITLGTFEMVLLNVYHNNNSVTCKELMERTKLKVSISDDDQDPGGLEPVVGSS
jgi:ABC-type molybdate transport system substrate-binding protein